MNKLFYCTLIFLILSYNSKGQIDTSGFLPGISLSIPQPGLSAMVSGNLFYKTSSNILFVSEFGVDRTTVNEPVPNATYNYNGLYGKGGIGVLVENAIGFSLKFIYSEYTASNTVHFEGNYWGDFDETMEAGTYKQFGMEASIDAFKEITRNFYLNLRLTANTPFSPEVKPDFTRLSRYHRPGYNWYVFSIHGGLNYLLRY